MKLTKKKLRKIIKEEINNLLIQESSSKEIQGLLERDYEKVSEQTSYPYRRSRGDIRRTTVYKRKDGEAIPDQDLKMIQDYESDFLKKYGSSAGFVGVYETTKSEDGMSLIVKYSKTSAG